MSIHHADEDGLLHSGIGMITNPQSTAVLGIQLALGAYFLWWIWRFKVSPRWNPSEPVQLPYWIPFLGHAPAFFKDSQALLTRGRQVVADQLWNSPRSMNINSIGTYFGNTRDPFSINIAGTKIYIITSPQGMALVYKNTTSVSFDDFIRDLHLAFGMSSYGRHAMWDKTRGKCLIHQANDLHHAQLQPGKHLDDLTDAFVAQIQQRIAWSRMVKDHPAANESLQLSLFDWCAEILIPAASVAVFGDALLQVDERVIEDFQQFEQDSWMMTYRYPPSLARKMYAGKDSNTATFTRYFQLPSDVRADACYYVRSLEARQREAGMKDRDIAISSQLFYWVADLTNNDSPFHDSSTNANAFKIAFWLLSYLLHNPTLLQATRQETLQSILTSAADGSKKKHPGMPRLLDQSPLLTAAWQETLRLTSGASSVRTVLSPTMLRSHCLQSGAKLLMPYRQLHFDDAAFGSHPVSAFRPERFLDEGVKRDSASAFKPFGGGVTYCSGRFIAKREVFAFVALVLAEYEISLDGDGVGQAMPRLDESTPTLGVMSPVKGDGTRVVVRRRED